MEQDEWLNKLSKLNVYRAKHGRAPHKPLLLLVVLELAERNELPKDVLWLTPELAFKFESFWRVVAYRRTQRPNIRMPFHHLSTDGFWTPLTETGDLSKHRQLTDHVELEAEFVDCANDRAFRIQARRILIAKYFEPAERNALYHLVRMRIPKEDEIARDANFEAPKDAAEAGRDGRFRLDVVAAYNYACALTGYRITTISAGTIVDAAHIHQFASSRNNESRNGMALCKNAHWLFDTGLWSLDDEYRIVVATGAFTETSPDQKPLTDYHGQRIRLPEDQRLWPDLKHITWHRKHKFQGS